MRISEIADALWNGHTVTIKTGDGFRYVGNISGRNKSHICIKSEWETWWIPIDDIVLFDPQD